MRHAINKCAYGPRHTNRAKAELAQQAHSNATTADGIGGGYTVTFTHEEGSLRVFVWANNRTHALNRALEFSDVAEWLPDHPGSTSGVMGMGKQPAFTPEGIIHNSMLAKH